MGSTLTHDPKEVIYNFSSYVLSETEKVLLCKGLNFAIPPKKLKFENYLLPFEILFRNVCNNSNKVSDDDYLLDLKCKIKDVGLSSLRSYNKRDHRFENLTKDEYTALLSLNSNNNIIIQKADKGNTVVILDRVSYVSEMESSIKHCLDNLLENNYLSKEDYNYMRPCGSKPGFLYGLCKVHKKPDEPNRLPPLRPILSAIGTCSYNLAKFFVPILKEFTINEYTIKDSFSFSNEIRNKSTSLYMDSFDIQSLFINIPRDETIDICLELLFNKKRKVKGMLKKHVKELLTHAVKSSTFMFNDVYYK